jgi:hypothetical protein
MATHEASFVVRFLVKDDFSLEQINAPGEAPKYRGWIVGDRTVQAHDEDMPWMLATVDLGTPLAPGDTINFRVHRTIDAEVSTDKSVKITPRRNDDEASDPT